MKMRISLLAAILLFFGALKLSAQDVRTVETRVADLLAQLPSKDGANTEKLMNDMLSLGDAGIKQICKQIVPIGTGDDTKARFAVESLSRYLSKKGFEKERSGWEKICISYLADQKDYTVKDFFMKQLQIIGGDASIEAIKVYLDDKNLCSPAVAVISAAGGSQAEKVLSESLKNKSLPCAAAVINSLASMRSSVAINEFIYWSGSDDKAIQAAAYNALAMTGDPKANAILTKAARQASYTWEHTGATEALLSFARVTGEKGDVKTMDNICKTVISNCNDRLNIQYKTEALDIMVRYHGFDAMTYLTDALNNNDKSYRNAALQLFLTLPEQAVTRKLMEFYGQAKPFAKPEIIGLLGDRKDVLAVPLVTASLSDQDIEVRKEAAPALVKIAGTESILALIGYLIDSSEQDDQAAVKSALTSVLDAGRTPMLIPALKESGNPGKKTIIEIFAWSKGQQYFSVVLPYTSDENEQVRSAAFKALADLSSPSDIDKLIVLLEKTEDPSSVADVQSALAAAANQIPDPEMRSSGLLKAMSSMQKKEKMIPVLAMTGGREALAAVLREFENGSVEMRSTCFKALTSWKDHSASSALYKICASKNKSYEGPAFDGYVRQVKNAPVTDEQRLLLFRKIMPYALDAARKNQVITELGKIRLYQSLFFTAGYLDDPSTSAAAAHALMVIALPSVDSKTGMTGTLVRGILNKAIPKLTGPEADYDRELVSKYIASMPDDEGFVPMFNGKDLTGWQGLVGTPLARAKMKPDELAKKQVEANKKMLDNWSVKDGCIYFTGNGDNLCSIKDYSDFELIVDWKITKKGDSGIYLRGSPQVQIWDTSRVEVGAQVGSGGLYNNKKNQKNPLKVADNPIDDWNSFRIVMIGEKVSVWLNGELVVDDVVLENYWDYSIPIFPKGAIELQAHGNELAFRDIFVKEINEREFNLTAEEKKDGFVALFNGRNLDNWIGNKESYVVEDGLIVIKPDKGSGGNLFTDKEFADFVFRFEFQLTPAANNGLGIRAPLDGDAAYVGMELQILDDTAPVYANLQPYQYHGSVYGVIPARRGFQKPVGEWNYEEVIVRGTQVKVILNGTVIVDGDISGPRDKGTLDHNQHPGLKNQTGHIGFLGHGSEVKFRNIRIREIIK
jgi:HEAT repeat protein